MQTRQLLHALQLRLVSSRRVAKRSCSRSWGFSDRPGENKLTIASIWRQGIKIAR
jgi:hypothetical protein